METLSFSEVLSSGNGDALFLRKLGFCLRVQTASQPWRSSSPFSYWMEDCIPGFESRPGDRSFWVNIFVVYLIPSSQTEIILQNVPWPLPHLSDWSIILQQSHPEIPTASLNWVLLKKLVKAEARLSPCWRQGVKEVWLLLILDFDTRGLVVNVTSRPRFTTGKGPRYPLSTRLGGRQSQSGHRGYGKIFCLCRGSNPRRDWATPAMYDLMWRSAGDEFSQQ
jgi:hypothetical protein